jgi:excisionase family DNA binding protein
MTKPVTWTPTARTALQRIEGRLFATVTETAAILSYHPETVRKAAAAGEIPSVRVGSSFRIPTAWLREQARGDAA